MECNKVLKCGVDCQHVRIYCALSLNDRIVVYLVIGNSVICSHTMVDVKMELLV